MTAFKPSSRMPSHRRVAVVGAVATGALLLTACGGEDSSDSPASSPARTAASAAGAFNDADVAFAQGMIPHHQQAVEMAELADGRASDQEIKTLTGQIENAQEPEIRTMRSWLSAWGKPESSGTDHGAAHGAGEMPGMMSDDDMTALMAAKGTDFDRKFAQMMIDHHNGAIDMAKDEQAKGRNAAAKKLADEVVKNQSAEVEQMRSILDRL